MKDYNYRLYGAILGDLAGQAYEFPKMGIAPKIINIHNPDAHITDDSLMTLASACSIMDQITPEESYKLWGELYSDDDHQIGYGTNFRKWLQSPIGTVNDSYGNGCLMRASPFMYIDDGLPLLVKSIQCSHNHTESFEACFELYRAYKYGLGERWIHQPERFEEFRVEAKPTIEFCLNLYAWESNKIRTLHQIITAVIKCSGDTDTNASIVAELDNYYNERITEQDARYVESKLDDYQLATLREFNEFINNKNKQSNG